MSEEEKLAKIREIFSDFSNKVIAVEQERDARLSKIMAGIDQRKIDEVMKTIQGKE